MRSIASTSLAARKISSADFQSEVAAGLDQRALAEQHMPNACQVLEADRWPLRLGFRQ